MLARKLVFRCLPLPWHSCGRAVLMGGSCASRRQLQIVLCCLSASLKIYALRVSRAHAATARTPLLTTAALASELRALFDASSPGGASLLQAGLRPKVLVGVAQLVEDVVSDDATLASRKHEALETLVAGLGDASAVARALLPVAVPESQVRPPSARIPPRVLLLRLNLLSYSCSSSTRLSERLAIAQSLQTAEFSLSQPRHPVSRVFPKLTGPMLFHPLLRQRQMHP